jgi:hypothetical protein
LIFVIDYATVHIGQCSLSLIFWVEHELAAFFFVGLSGELNSPDIHLLQHMLKRGVVNTEKEEEPFFPGTS